MQYPGVSPFGGFGGTNILTSRLSPMSLEQRKQQLVHQMVTGSNQSNLTVGAGQGDSPGRAPGLGFNPFMESYLSSLSASQDPQSPFFGGGGNPSGAPSGNPSVSGAPTPTVPTPGPPPVTTGPSPMATGQGITVSTPTAPAGGSRQLINTYVPARGGVVGGHNMYYGLDPQGVGALAQVLAGRGGGSVF